MLTYFHAHQDHRSFLQSCFLAGNTQCVQLSGVIPSKVQDFPFTFVELEEIHTYPLSVEVVLVKFLHAPVY